GFYHIAKRANVPIVFAYMDYGNKVMGMDEVFIPTDDEQADLKYIKHYFTQFTACHPENFATGDE
ncbi:MAG: acyltransferase, partial [Bacteroidales bacterium]